MNPADANQGQGPPAARGPMSQADIDRLLSERDGGGGISAFFDAEAAAPSAPAPSAAPAHSAHPPASASGRTRQISQRDIDAMVKQMSAVTSNAPTRSEPLTPEQRGELPSLLSDGVGARGDRAMRATTLVVPLWWRGSLLALLALLGGGLLWVGGNLVALRRQLAHVPATTAAAPVPSGDASAQLAAAAELLRSGDAAAQQAAQRALRQLADRHSDLRAAAMLHMARWHHGAERFAQAAGAFAEADQAQADSDALPLASDLLAQAESRLAIGDAAGARQTAWKLLANEAAYTGTLDARGEPQSVLAMAEGRQAVRRAWLLLGQASLSTTERNALSAAYLDAPAAHSSGTLEP